MNFLLHHDFAMTELEVAHRSVGAVGAMLPDLWRMADRRVRPRELPAAALVDDRSPALRALLDGIEHHRQIDRWFHRSNVFTNGEKSLRQRLFETKSPKLLLFAHPAWEMCLDGALLRERGVAVTASMLGVALDEAHAHLAQAADIHHFEHRQRPSTDRAKFDGRMARIVAAGRGGGLFEDYLHAFGIARRLAGMRMAFGFGPPETSELDRWTAALGEALEAADAGLIGLREERARMLVAVAHS